MKCENTEPEEGESSAVPGTGAGRRVCWGCSRGTGSRERGSPAEGSGGGLARAMGEDAGGAGEQHRVQQRAQKRELSPQPRGASCAGREWATVAGAGHLEVTGGLGGVWRGQKLGDGAEG